MDEEARRHTGDGARETEGPSGSLFLRLGWFVLLWLAGVATVGTVAYAIRSMLL